MKLLFDMWTLLGAFVFVIGICLFIRYVIIEKIKEIMKRQTKLQLLCQHEYVPTFRFYNDKNSEYHLTCRKCNHKKVVYFYNEEIKR